MRAPSILAQCWSGLLLHDRESHGANLISERDIHLSSPAVEILPSKVSLPLVNIFLWFLLSTLPLYDCCFHSRLIWAYNWCKKICDGIEVEFNFHVRRASFWILLNCKRVLIMVMLITCGWNIEEMMIDFKFEEIWPGLLFLLFYELLI